MKEGACFRNAYILASVRDLVYAEGFAISPLASLGLVHHAWCLDASGTVIDVTWKDSQACRYYGIPFRLQFVHKVAVRNHGYLTGGVLMQFE
jgi:hypothetical protein